MKKIIIEDGQIIHAYELDDLDEQTRQNVISEHGQFLYENTDCEDEDGNPEELEYPEESEIIENMEINGYLFDEDGELLPTVYHYEGNKYQYTTYGRKHPQKCTIDPPMTNL